MAGQQQEEIETIRSRTIEVKLSDADVKRISEKAAAHGLTVGELIENFIGDLDRTLVLFLEMWYTMCMKENLIHSRTCVYNINYHVVWSVKYRRKILNAEVEKYLKELVEQIAMDKGFIVHLFEVGEGDHIHCFVSAPPKLSVTDIVKYLKGISGRKLFEQFPEIRQKLWKGQLWNHSYYVETIGSVSEENIRRYIEHQSKSY